MEVKVTSKLVSGLKDGFSGSPLEVFMVVKPKSPPLFYCPKAVSVHIPYDNLLHLQDVVSMRHGISGVHDSVHPKCPYTGADLKLRTYPDGRYSFTGGLNPRRAFMSLEELVYYLSMRDGKPTSPKPKSCVAVKPRAGHKELPEQNAPSDDTREAVEKAVEAAGLPRQTRVSLAGTKKPGAKKSGAKEKGGEQ